MRWLGRLTAEQATHGATDAAQRLAQALADPADRLAQPDAKAPDGLAQAGGETAEGVAEKAPTWLRHWLLGDDGLLWLRRWLGHCGLLGNARCSLAGRCGVLIIQSCAPP